ncbi:anti-repressor SinI family protein [Bacillus sp. FJAT-52991]|uniref:Anti-repressor SinI family protein n=1 Tax=Bacillus kandeliae TaxID=3129297 RepID=A0ABZ2N560_9BACI
MGNVQLIDQEWIDLMLEAKKLGLTLEEVREFIEGEKLGLQKVEST